MLNADYKKMMKKLLSKEKAGRTLNRDEQIMLEALQKLENALEQVETWAQLVELVREDI